jgi:formate hydrogenlyase subunit 3/multisubunit Na+/H+ antiporter MnhD subunit
MTHLGAGAILLGFLILTEGSLMMEFSSISDSAASVSQQYALAALLLFFFGFASKAGLFPFHGWLPEAHPEAPSHISALLSGVMLAIAVYGMINVLLFFSAYPYWFAILILTLGLLSALLGAFYAIIDIDIKRILAWSSIENMGLIFALIGISLLAFNEGMDVLSGAMLALSVFLAIAHAFFKSGLFLASGVLSSTFHTRSIESMGGIAKSMKVFSALVLVLTLAASALPPFAPFSGEITVIQSMFSNSFFASPLLKIALLMTIGMFGIVAGAGAFAMVKFFGIAFLAQSRTASVNISREPHKEYLFSIAFLVAGVTLLGIFAQRVLDTIARSIVEMPTNGAIVPIDMFSLVLFMVFVLLTVGIINVFTSEKRHERSYQTWNCGQPIDATMEYTGTAFSAPVRFLFKPLLKANRNLSVQPIVAENYWFVKKQVHIDVKPLSDVYFYMPISRGMSRAAMLVRKIQSGNIHFYILLILLTLIVCAIIAL